MRDKEYLDDFDNLIDTLSDTLDTIDDIDDDYDYYEEDYDDDDYSDEYDEDYHPYGEDECEEECDECDDDDSCTTTDIVVVDSGDTDNEYIEQLEAFVNTNAPLEPESKTSRKVKVDVFESGEDDSPDSGKRSADPCRLYLLSVASRKAHSAGIPSEFSSGNLQ